MTTLPVLPTPAAKYLTQLAHALSTLPEAERRAITDETKAHFMDSFAAGGDDALTRTLQAFDQPETYAANFVKTAQIRAAVHSGSIFGMLKHTLLLAFTGIGYFFASLAAFCLYITAFGFGLTGILKPFMSDQIGFWLGDGGLVFGTLPADMRPTTPELLGYWIIPISFVLCFVLLVAANWVVRKTLLRHLHRKNT